MSSDRTGYVLDTNVIIHSLRGDPSVRRHLSQHRPTTLHITSITIAELEFGSLKSPTPDHHRRRWREAIRHYGHLAFDEAAALHHAHHRLATRHQPIGERDLLIAAIANANGLSVVTNNLSEFKRVRGLRVVDWSGSFDEKQLPRTPR